MFHFNPRVKIFATGSSRQLGEKICNHLQEILPLQLRKDQEIALSSYKLSQFDNGCFEVKIEQSVRGDDVVVLHTHSTGTANIHEDFFELFALLDALSRAKTGEIILVLPYVAYWRSDKKNKPRISVMAKSLIQIIEGYGIEKIILLNPHDPHIKHYFKKDADEITAIYLLAQALKERENIDENWKVVFSDPGASKNFENFPGILNLFPVYVYKKRDEDTGKITEKKIIGNVSGKNCILIDDEVLTFGTGLGDIELLKESGAEKIISAVVHGVFSGKKENGKGGPEEIIKRIENSLVDKFFFTDSVFHQEMFTEKFSIISVAKLLAQAINCAITGESINNLHNIKNVSLYC